jgi:hypothetical protein
VCSSGGGGGAGFSNEGDVAVDLVAAFAGLTFRQAVKLVQHPTDDDRWYALERGGEIHTFLASDPGNTDGVRACSGSPSTRTSPTVARSTSPTPTRACRHRCSPATRAWTAA